MTRPCRATHDNLSCCRALPHDMPHMAPDGTQWDQHGVRVRRANDPWKGEIR